MAKTPPIWLVRALVAVHVGLYRLSGGARWRDHGRRAGGAGDDAWA